MHMNTAIARTSITIHATMLERLKLVAQIRHQTVSQVVTQAVAEHIAEPLTTASPERYRALFKLKGIAKADPRLKDMSVDDILYGKYEGWRGSEK